MRCNFDVSSEGEPSTRAEAERALDAFLARLRELGHTLERDWRLFDRGHDEIPARE